MTLECITDSCSICLNSLKQAKFVLPCSHTFHIKCAIQWLIKNNSCPLCREHASYIDDEDSITSILENVSDQQESHYESYACGSKEQIHTFLIAMGGRGLTDEIWNGFLNYEIFQTDIQTGIPLEIIMNSQELIMLMATNGCTRIISTEIWHNITEHFDWSGQEQHEDEINDGGSTS